jgi:hypothetical protein
VCRYVVYKIFQRQSQEANMARVVRVGTLWSLIVLLDGMGTRCRSTSGGDSVLLMMETQAENDRYIEQR